PLPVGEGSGERVGSCHPLRSAALLLPVAMTRLHSRCASRVGRLCAALLMILLFAAPPQATAEDEVDYVELAAVLAPAGEMERAGQALKEVDLSVEGVDIAKYHTVRGLVAMDRQRLEEAAEAFGEAFKAGQTDPLIHLYRAQALFGLERYADAVAAIDQA